MRIANRFVLFAAMILVPAPQPPPSLAGIAHVALRVSDVPKSREFYRNLGFEQAFEFADSGKPPVSYVKINDQQFIELYGGADDAHPPGTLHVCYEVSDLESLIQVYTARGLNPPPARKARAGNLLLLLHDPERSIIEFTQYLPGSLHFEDHGKHLGAQRISHHLIEAGINVRDLSVERAFYTSKLGFEEAGSTGLATKLRLPGDSGEQIEVDASKPEPRPRLVFQVVSLSRTSEELQRVGFVVRLSNVSVSVSDPDGSVLVFVPARDPLR